MKEPVPEQSVRPGINANYLDPEINPADWVERFEREGREVFDLREQIVETVGLQPGDRVADVGSGTGLFTTLLSREVGEKGRVYAVDIVPRFLASIDTRAAEMGVRNIDTVLCAEDSVRLRPASVDKVFICDTYHHFEYPRSTMASIHSALRPDGEVFLIDFKRIPGESSDFIMNHVRAGQEVVTAEIEAVGFEKIAEYDFLEENYVIRFRKVGE